MKRTVLIACVAVFWMTALMSSCRRYYESPVKLPPTANIIVSDFDENHRGDTTIYVSTDKYHPTNIMLADMTLKGTGVVATLYGINNIPADSALITLQLYGMAFDPTYAVQDIDMANNVNLFLTFQPSLDFNQLSMRLQATVSTTLKGPVVLKPVQLTGKDFAAASTVPNSVSITGIVHGRKIILVPE